MPGESDQIGSYTIRRRLGAGGMGEVFLAEHRHIDRKAAIKILLPELSSRADTVARFFAEARAASRIKHPGIVEIVDCEMHPDGRAYIIMELLDGESLRTSLDRIRTFDVGSALGIAGQIAAALSAAHSKGIVHRDLKPDNVFLASAAEGETALSVKVLDFGIAKLLAYGDVGQQRTQTGYLIGTPVYMSAEQCRGTGKIDHRTDVYSLGCILYEMIAGRPPFVHEGVGELIAAHLTEPPRDILSLQPSARSGPAELVMKMIAKNPDARPQSMLDVVGQIEGLLKVPSAEFSSLVVRPEGFEAMKPASETAAPSEKVGEPNAQHSAGNTRILPLKSALLIPATPTGETTARVRKRAERSWLAWVMAISTAVAILGFAAYAGLGIAHRPSRSSPELVVRSANGLEASHVLTGVPRPPPRVDQAAGAPSLASRIPVSTTFAKTREDTNPVRKIPFRDRSLAQSGGSDRAPPLDRQPVGRKTDTDLFAAAQASVDRGERMLREENYAAAFREFVHAHYLVLTPRARADIGLAEIGLKRWVNAEADLSTALSNASDPWIKQNGVILGSALRSARGQLATLEVGGPAGAIVTINGSQVGRLPLSQPIRLPCGPTTVELRNDGFAPEVRTVSIPPGSFIRQEVILTPLTSR